MCYNKDTVRERKISNRKEYIKMVEFTQKQLKEIAKFDWVKDITTHQEADKVCEPLDQVGYSHNKTYGINGKMWRGRNSGDIYVCHTATSVLYRF